MHAYNAIVEVVEAEESGVHDHSLGYIANSKSAWTICDPATNDSQKLHRSFLILGKVSRIEHWLLVSGRVDIMTQLPSCSQCLRVLCVFLL